MPHREAYPVSILTQTNSLWFSNTVVILKSLMQACGSIHRALWKQHCLHRDIILLGEILEDTMVDCVFYMWCRLEVMYDIQNYMKIISNFINTLLIHSSTSNVMGAIFFYLFHGLH